MNSTHPTSAGDTSNAVSGPRWLAALGAAMGLQVAAAAAGLAAVAIVLVAAFDDWADRDNEGMPAYVLLSLPVGFAAPCLFVASGLAASRIVGDRRGWWALLAGPLVWAVLRSAAFAM